MQPVNRDRPPFKDSLQDRLTAMITAHQRHVSTSQPLERPANNPVAWAKISAIAREIDGIGKKLE